MKRRLTVMLAAIAVMLPLIFVFTTSAHNPSGADIPSPGRPAAAITVNGNDADWPGAGPSGPYAFAITDYGSTDPLTGPLGASVKVLHKGAGLYLFATITDAQANSASDAIQIRFDMNHNGTLDAPDWGVEIKRSGATAWGPATSAASTWGVAPAGIGASDNGGGATWKAEFHLPTAATGTFAGFQLNLNQPLGIHIEIFDADPDSLSFPNSAIYTQWPQPTVADGLDTLFDNTPDKWGHYSFDPASTFPNVSVTGVRRGGGVGPSDYYRISHTQLNTFQVTVNNPGTSAIADATGVRLNLYLGAVGLGEPFHRLDQVGTIDADCAGTWSPLASLPQADVCTGPTSLADVETIANPVLVTNNAKYTIKNGVTRSGGSSITVNGGTSPTTDVDTWDTTAGQDPKFDTVTVMGADYHRQHACMRAEALVPNDPNPFDNTMQVNMDFVCIPGGSGQFFFFNIGAGAFGQYIPAQGKDMFIHLVKKNMNQEWSLKLSDPKGQIKQVRDNLFVANLQGIQSIPATLNITAPRAEVLGRTLKENLFVPAKAGGRQANAVIPSGDAPVYVKVNAGSTLLIANFSFHSSDDTQFVDIDGTRKLFPPNGPAGLSNELLQKALKEVAEFKLLLSPTSPLGSLVGSFDNFRTSFPIAEGGQVKVPAGATHLALGINDAIGLYNDNNGTGFRVKVIERAPGAIVSNQSTEDEEGFSLIPTAHAQAAADTRLVIPLAEAVPSMCLNGYEKTTNVRDVAGKKRELYRYIGNMCWTVLNVFPPTRPEKPDQGDPFEGGGPKRGGCGAKRGTILFPIVFAAVGIGMIGRVARRRRR